MHIFCILRVTASLKKEHIQVFVLLINLPLILQRFVIFSTVRKVWLYEELVFRPLRSGPWLEFTNSLSEHQGVRQASGAALKKENFSCNNLFNNFNYVLQMEVFLNYSVFSALNLRFIALKGCLESGSLSHNAQMRKHTADCVDLNYSCKYF